MPVERTRLVVASGEVAAIRVAGPSAPGPGALLAHDAWGLDDEAVVLAEALATTGFTVLAPDLAGGRRAADAAEARAIAATIDPAFGLEVLAAAADALAADPATRPGAVVVVGVGSGAPLAVVLAALRPEIRATVVVDGPVPSLPLETWGMIDAALLVVPGAGDDDSGDGAGGGATGGDAGVDPGARAPDAIDTESLAALDVARAAGVEVRILGPVPGWSTGGPPSGWRDLAAAIAEALARRLAETPD